MEIKHLSQPILMGSKTSPNRFVILPTERNDSNENGAPSERTINRYKKLAQGEAGIIFIEAVAVHHNARARVNQLVLSAETAEKFTEMIAQMRQVNPDTLVILQLDHAGNLADPTFAEAVSVYAQQGDDARLLSDTEIETIIDRFARAAALAEQAGADGVDIKSAHGFLCNAFLQPANTREGQYGGSMENRFRFFKQLVEKIKAGAQSDFILGTRISVFEGIPGGFGTTGPEEVIEDLAEPVEFAQMAQRIGLDFISVSAGNAAGNLEILLPTSAYPEGVYRHFSWTKHLKQAVDIPVIGAAYSYLGKGANDLPGDASKKNFVYWAEKNLQDGNTDLVGIGRQAIADPLFPQKVLAGDLGAINYCVTCLGCGMLLGSQEHTGCVVYDDYYRKIHNRLNVE